MIYRIFVSIPVDATGDPNMAKLEEKGVRGRYCSVESIKELDGGRVEWRMVTSSTPGGSIPNFFVENSLPSQIAAVSVSFRVSVAASYP